MAKQQKQTTGDSKYINGLFVVEKEGNYGPYISVGITDEGLEALQNLPRSSSGFRNFTLTRQKNDNSKFSAKPVKSNSSAGDDDQLPWE